MTRIPRVIGILSALLALAGTLCAEESVVDITINDQSIREEFEAGLEALRQSPALVPAVELIEQLRAQGAGGARSSETHPQLSLSKPGERAMTSSEVYRSALQSTLIVGNLYQCGKCSRWHSSLAGGVLIDASGVLVTNYHVIDSDKVAVFAAMTVDGEVFPIVEVLAASKADDLAIVRVRADKDLAAAPLADRNEPVGAEIRVISHPDGRFYTFSEGIAARYFLDPGKRSARLQITADYARGSSGCGVFNETGALVGIVSSTDSIYYTEENKVQRNLQMVVKSCIPLDSVRRLLSKWTSPRN